MWTTLAKKISYLPDKEKRFIKKAYYFALKAHKGQKRASGAPYFLHPFKVALLLAEHKMEKEVIASGLLHDVCEDTKTDLEDIKKKFGEKVALLVDGVSAIGKIQNQADLNFKNQNQQKQILKLQKLILTSAKDLRVIFIRIFDRKHNMEDLEVFPEKKRIRKAKETLKIYAPLAKKIGMTKIGEELEDKAFFYLYPILYKKIKALREKHLPGTLYLINSLKEKIVKECKKRKIKILQSDHRIKSLFSLYKKLKYYNINQIYDLAALRLIVKSKKECYEVLGIVHEMYKPMINRIKDYIAQPKHNDYQSLHTTVFIKEKKPLEIQIRTKKMHYHAEFGLAAHWVYKNEYSSKEAKEWIKNLNLAYIKNYNLENFFSNQIYVFTPKGKIIELPIGSTALDFAFAIHTEIGKRTKIALINNQIKPLDYKIKNGQIIEIKTAKTAQVSPLWLEKVKTSEAKQKIQSFLRNQNKEEKIKQAKEAFYKKLKFFGKSQKDWQKKLPLILKKMNFLSEENLFLHFYEGKIKIEQILNFMLPPRTIRKPKTLKKETEAKVLIAGEKGLKIKLSACCQPKSNDRIIGYISKENQISIHKANCPLISNLDRSRFIPAWWEGEKEELEILALDRPGLLRDIATVFTQKNINILSVQNKRINNNLIEIRVAFDKPVMLNLMEIIKKIEGIFGVTKVII